MGDKLDGITAVVAVVIWQIGSIATFGFLTFFDGYVYTWWNWLIAIPVNAFLAEIWPLYWLLIRPFFG